MPGWRLRILFFKLKKIFLEVKNFKDSKIVLELKKNVKGTEFINALEIEYEKRDFF